MIQNTSPPTTHGGGVELICVGTELLLGDILNTNAQFLANQFATLGIPHYYQTAVGDNPGRIQQSIAVACERSQLLIFTGGLGPTPDDLTTATLADFFNVNLVERTEVVDDISHKYALRGQSINAKHRKQALLPEGAEILPNPVGSAPGMIWSPQPQLTILTFPGVPSELKVMWSQTAVPYLRGQGWGKELIQSRTLKFWGIGESTLTDKIDDLLNSGNPTVAPYADHGEVKLRISARAVSDSAAQQLIQPIEERVRKLFGPDCYGVDEETLALIVGQRLRQRDETLAVAESCTGGGLGQLITEVPGSSSYFLGGIIAYDNSVKINSLGVDSTVLKQEGAVSASVAKQMAMGVCKALGTTWGLSITGIAGPTGSTPTKPIGLVYVGLAGPDADPEAMAYSFGPTHNRTWIRCVSANTALDQLRRRLCESMSSHPSQ